MGSGLGSMKGVDLIERAYLITHGGSKSSWFMYTQVCYFFSNGVIVFLVESNGVIVVSERVPSSKAVAFFIYLNFYSISIVLTMWSVFETQRACPISALKEKLIDYKLP